MWWRNPPAKGGEVGQPRGAAQVGWSWRGDQQQHVRVGWFYSKSMLRRLLRSRAERRLARLYHIATRWAAWHGVPGQVVHFEPRRPELWTARNMQRMGMAVPADLATSCPARKLIGPECPVCNAEGEREIRAWYFSFTGPRRPKRGRAHTGVMHTLGYCPRIREKTHRWVREHPQDIYLFDPLPQGQEPGALP